MQKIITSFSLEGGRLVTVVRLRLICTHKIYGQLLLLIHMPLRSLKHAVVCEPAEGSG